MYLFLYVAMLFYKLTIRNNYKPKPLTVDTSLFIKSGASQLLEFDCSEKCPILTKQHET